MYLYWDRIEISVLVEYLLMLLVMTEAGSSHIHCVARPFTIQLIELYKIDLRN